MVPTDTAILYAAESAANWTGTATIPLTDTDAATLVNAMVDWLITNGWAITPNPTVAITSTASGVAASAWIDGPMIDTIYLTLVRAFYGDANADALADAFAEYGVATVE